MSRRIRQYVRGSAYRANLRAVTQLRRKHDGADLVVIFCGPGLTDAEQRAIGDRWHFEWIAAGRPKSSTFERPEGGAW